MTAKTLYAKQEQRGGLGALVIPALVIGGLLFAGRRGSGNGAATGDVPAGMARVDGGITGITVSQGAPMAQEVIGPIEKAVQSSLVVELRFNANTTRNGQAIQWPYYLIVRIGHSTLFGWQQAGSGRLPNFNDLNGNPVQFPWASTQIDTSTGGTIRLPTMRIPNDPGVTWDVHAQLRAQESDEFGNPNGVWMNLGPEFREDGAFTIVPASSPASVGGSISTVTVSQPLPSETLPLPSGSRRGLRLTGRL